MPEANRPTCVFVLGLAPVKIGGMEKFLRLFVLAMDKAGWDTVLCFDGAIADEFRATVDFPFCHIEQVPNQGNLGFAAAGPLWRVLRRYRPQSFLYVFHGVMRCFPWLARLSGCRRICFYDQSSRPPDFVARPLSLPKRIVGRFLTAPIRLIVSVTEFTRRTGLALGLTSAPGVVMPNGVPVQPGSPERGKAFREGLGIPEDAAVVTQLCWMVPVKGVDVLLRAASVVLSEKPDTRFLLVGGGSHLPEYQQLAVDLGIEHRVIFTGVLSNPSDKGVFDASDVYCQPSLWQEAAGIAAMEAMSFRVPAVVSRIGGLPELVQDGSNGLLFPPGDSDAMAAAILRLVRDPELRRRMGDQAREDILREHRIEDMAGNLAAYTLGIPA